MEIEIVRRHLKDMLEARGEDVSYIEEHGDAVDPSRYYTEMIHLGTNRTTTIFVLTKDLVKEWKTKEGTPEFLMEKYGTKQFMLLMNDAPSSAVLQQLQAIDRALQAQGGMLQLFYMKELMYNPLKHSLVPKHEKMTEEEVKKLMESYMVKSKSQLPVISRNDVIARWLGLRHGDVVRITRYNDTSGMYYYYRCCV
jgi:DNA-directed RNA polymerase subunit H (RpoH/RPB5)